MHRVSSRVYEDELVLEDLETEGERQLQNLLKHQLDTSVSIDQCVAKRKCFAPASLYTPFGKQAAGALSLSQFQALQEEDTELATLRELGLTDQEVHLWKNRDSAEKFSGFGADPEAMQERLQAIEEKISERQRILALPQRFAGSKQLNRREMEIENALFQGTDRHRFLRALYYQDENHKRTEYASDPITQLELMCDNLSDNSESQLSRRPQSQGYCTLEQDTEPEVKTENGAALGNASVAMGFQMPKQDGKPTSDNSWSVSVKQPIRSLPSCSADMPVKVTEHVNLIPEEEILRNRLSEEEIRKLPRFSSYQQGEPNKVLYLKNLNPKATLEDLFSLFARFQKKGDQQFVLQLLTGRMKGQAFVTFPNVETAMEALNLINGYNLMGKPIIIEYGRNKPEQ
ncbi:RNA-binding protein 41 isoform X2 [Latimeria chalumnae]|uniref:RNA-binding protein 41 isoform X2 n=1 Tax=Latimeria chalumnae TaxID=7897 RepID=UPI0003C0FDA6|nr:PREDICTED: RNA-binding protein 41 isoform X2 [Latimeria chalumnae]|eukprot:XP_006001369.1 PREDICTED: RNA-binding protein 41 isoform X2 [Latimeria chalumnae]